MTKPITTVAIIGSGFMGIQIAVRAALYGSHVRIYDLKKEALDKAKSDIKLIIDVYSLEGQFKGDPGPIHKMVSYYSSLADAVEDTDLIIEIVPERLELKKEVFAQLDKLAPASTIIATNSSSLPVSKIESAVVRKDKVANIHFYAPVMKNYFVDIAGGTATSKETIQALDAWARSIGCLPLLVKKECLGFVFNRIWRAVKRESLTSWANGNADFEDIDRAWMIWSGMPTGPFAMMDSVGLDVVYDIEMQYYLDSGDPKDRPPDALKAMIDRGELGVKSGKGFYDWTNPEFAKPDFLRPR
jgi:3-hydroxybutyryl-CoA dehydrogenase